MMQSGKIIIISLVLLFQLRCAFDQQPYKPDNGIIQSYVSGFNQKDNELYAQHIPNDSAFSFLSANIPLIEIPDKEIEEIYYFRWWTYRKHIKHTDNGFVITEFLPEVSWAGKYNTISCPAGHHIYEGRWLRNPQYISDYIEFWLNDSGEGIRSYSFWIADAVLAFQMVHMNDSILTENLPGLIANYKEWGQIRRDSLKTLFWQIDDRDGMEYSVSGQLLNDGVPIGAMPAVRPSINSYMYGDAKAISAIAEMTDNPMISAKYQEEALALKNEVQRRLWNEKLGFFTVLPRDFDSTTKSLDVREAIGYIPWYFNLPDDNDIYSNAWKKVMDTTGFYAPYGLTVCERAHPLFAINYSGHQCQWNGPSWPFATTQTLKGLSNLLNNYTNTGGLSKADYYQLLRQYAASHSMVTDQGEKQNWIDENINPFTGDWISRTRLKSWENGTWSKKKGGEERGKDYNHSGFCDLVISDLLGLKPRKDHVIEINPLIPDDWDWFYLDKIKYRGRELTIVWDKTGDKYKQGKGLMLFIDGILKAKSENMGRLTYEMDTRSENQEILALSSS
ncbi:MAG: trehalase family glycosidase [Cyclobacteriaceae bacterium]